MRRFEYFGRLPSQCLFKFLSQMSGACVIHIKLCELNTADHSIDARFPILFSCVSALFAFRYFYTSQDLSLLTITCLRKTDCWLVTVFPIMGAGAIMSARRFVARANGATVLSTFPTETFRL